MKEVPSGLPGLSIVYDSYGSYPQPRIEFGGEFDPQGPAAPVVILGTNSRLEYVKKPDSSCPGFWDVNSYGVLASRDRAAELAEAEAERARAALLLAINISKEYLHNSMVGEISEQAHTDSDDWDKSPVYNMSRTSSGDNSPTMRALGGIDLDASSLVRGDRHTSSLEPEQRITELDYAIGVKRREQAEAVRDVLLHPPVDSARAIARQKALKAIVGHKDLDTLIQLKDRALLLSVASEDMACRLDERTPLYEHFLNGVDEVPYYENDWMSRGWNEKPLFKYAVSESVARNRDVLNKGAEYARTLLSVVNEVFGQEATELFGFDLSTLVSGSPYNQHTV